jgi:ethanolamine kinase
LYCFIRGHVTSPADLIKPSVWRGVARHLAQWHASLPITRSNESSQSSVSVESDSTEDYYDLAKSNGTSKVQLENNITPIRPRQAGPNMWTVMQKWILALPVSTEEQRLRQKSLQSELERIADELDDGSGIGDNGVR